ncbi:MAG TPA: hypothetical protein VGG28_21640 [Kofleriaceae bacterium]|jgi:hypothetical protein
MLTPNFATRVRPFRPIAAALVLGLAFVPFTSSVPGRGEAGFACRRLEANANAADLVGIYRSTACTLTLDAAGTYDCGTHAGRYSTSGNQVVLGTQRLAISGPGRLVAADGTIYSITGGTR